MTKFTSKHGFYTLEAAVVLPFVILAVLTIGLFIKIDSLWENCMYGAIDESTRTAAKACDTVSLFAGKKNVTDRIIDDNSAVSSLTMNRYYFLYSDLYADKVTSFSFTVGTEMAMPAGFGRELTFTGRIKYRGFTGRKERKTGIGADALETDQPKDPVWIFPQSGTKYHMESCTYVTATVTSCVLSESLRKSYASCDMCHSENMKAGNIVFCFRSENTAYHRGSCRSIKRHPAVINRSEAEEKGYNPCSKCGGKGD